MNSTDLQPKHTPDYFNKYLGLLGEVDLIKGLKHSRRDFLNYLQTIQEEHYSYAYQKGKWSIAEVIQHLVDSERVFQFRAFYFARNPGSELLGFDHESFAEKAKLSLGSKAQLIEQYESVRNSSIKLFENFSKEELLHLGSLAGQPASVAALGFFLLGHQKHHLNILEKKYLYKG